MARFRHAVFISLILTLILSAISSHAAVKPNVLFSDGAVLQQGMSVPVFGTASDGEKVTVQFQSQTVSAVAHGGYWIVRLKPLKAGGPFTMKINDLELKNILVGEVWLCGGQSNMVWPVNKSANGEAAIAASKDPMLRLFTVPQTDKAGTEIKASWLEASPETVGAFSGVGYFFGRDLRRNLGIPVGLISSCVGGTPAEAWMSREALKSDADFAYMFQNPPRKGKARPTALYNAMIAPLLPYGIKGAIWYQGEANADRPMEYRRLFPAMIKNWRDAWGQGDFPFLFAQLAPYAAKDRDWPGTWESQLLVSKTVPNTAMAVITDIGEENDIHPKQKEPVGHRLALAARALVYGEPIEYSGPVYRAMKVEADKVILSFDHVGSGLTAPGGQLTDFTIAGTDGKFVPASAEILGGRQVIVSSPEVRNPVAVRYGWSNWTVASLFNNEGLPASPFRTDIE